MYVAQIGGAVEFSFVDTLVSFSISEKRKKEEERRNGEIVCSMYAGPNIFLINTLKVYIYNIPILFDRPKYSHLLLLYVYFYYMQGTTTLLRIVRFT
jgi:hypothetical protein